MIDAEQEQGQKLAEIIAVKLERGATYLIAVDERKWTQFQLKWAADVLKKEYDIDLVAFLAAFDPDGSCGIKFLDPDKHEEKQ